MVDEENYLWLHANRVETPIHHALHTLAKPWVRQFAHHDHCGEVSMMHPAARPPAAPAFESPATPSARQQPR
jgi:hypothetical protein